MGQSSTPKDPEYVSQATTVLGEVLSRGTGLAIAYPVNDIEAAQLAGIVEVKVKTLSHYPPSSHH